MIFLLVLIIFGLIIFNLPRIVAWCLPRFLAWKLHRAYTSAAKEQGRHSRQQQPKQPHGPRPTKKIDPTVGEYIHFEEIEVNRTTTTQTQSDGSQTSKTTVTVEEQVVDAEWEDIE